MAYFKFDNKKVFYRVRGKGDPLFLLHGNSVSSLMFSAVIGKYSKHFQVIAIDFPGHGNSDRVDQFETDFWFYNATVVKALIDELKFDKVSVIGSSGGALVGINLALEYPDRVKFLIADSFEGEFPLSSYINTIESDRKRDKKKFLAKVIWLFCHGSDWRNVVDSDTKVNIEFAKTGQSFFHKSISDLKVPTLLTGSTEDEYCDHIDKIYADLKAKNNDLEIHLFDKGYHPAMLSNKKEFLKLVLQKRYEEEMKLLQGSLKNITLY